VKKLRYIEKYGLKKVEKGDVSVKSKDIRKDGIFGPISEDDLFRFISW
jgi:hypothetical protein